MIRKFSFFRMVTFIFLGPLLLLPLGSSFAYPVGSNGWHLDSPLQVEHNADLVCKVRVLSIHRHGLIESNVFPGAQDVSRMIATSKVLSVIKGKCPQVINIEFHYPRDRNLELGLPLWQLYTELSEAEVCIVFLKEATPYYKLNRIRSKLRVQPEVVGYNLGDTPYLRLLAEFLAGCNSENKMIKLQAVEELGYLGQAMIDDLRPFKGSKELFAKIAFGLGEAKEALRKTRRCEDLVIRNASIISSFQVDDSPGIEAPLTLLRLNPAEFDPNDSRKKYGIRDFCISSLQLKLLETMDATTRRAVVNLKDGSVIRRKDARPGIFRGVRGFDYAGFYKRALDCEVVKKNEAMRSDIANVIWIRYEKRSVPEMIQLLDDSNINIRRTAASALRKCINSDLSNSWDPVDFYRHRTAKAARGSSTEEKPHEERLKDYADNEKEYILYWKKWWQENKN